jgi:hypothetical protein
MVELVVENLNGKNIARVLRASKSAYKVMTKDDTARNVIESLIEEAKDKGIPLRFDKRQRTTQGIKFQRLARWVMPDDDDFLEALADELAKHGLFSYTVETPSKLVAIH